MGPSQIVFTVLTVVFISASHSLDIQSYMNNIQVADLYSSQEGESQHVTLEPEIDAVVGRLFNYKLPESIGNIELKGIPDWILYDVENGQLQGIPNKEHLGMEYTIKLTEDTSPFSVNVIPDKVRFDDKVENSKEKINPDEAERILCPSGMSVTKATVIVDVDMKTLQPKQMVSVIENLGCHLNMPSELLRIFPAVKKQPANSAALVAGAGDVDDMKTEGTSLQWEVGCGYVQPFHLPILQLVESSSRDGSMSNSLGYGVAGWHVTNNRPSMAVHKRMKRRSRNHDRRARNRHENGRTREAEEGSGFWTEEPIIEPKPGPSSPEIHPTKTNKPHHTRTHKPRPEKTTGRHHQHSTTKHPTSTDDIIPTTPIISPTKTESPMEMTSTPDMHRSTPTLPKVMTDSTSAVTPPLPKVSTPPAITDAPIETTKHVVVDVKNRKPKVNHGIKKIMVQVGNILDYRVPAKTFHDEDGNARHLKLQMVTKDMYNLHNDSWVKFNEELQTIFGMPLERDVGTHHYRMLAIDSKNKIGHDAFEIQVARNPSQYPENHEFSMRLDLDYNRFMIDALQRVDVTQKLANVYGDKDMSKITVTKLSKGSVQYAWTNNSLSGSSCPVEALKHLASFLINTNHTLNENFRKMMSPYKVHAAGLSPKGVCEEGDVELFPPSTFIPIPAEGEVNIKETSEDDQFITTIVPVVVVTAMLLVAAIVICCLYHRRHKEKLADEGNGTFITKKGIPVIFSDELEEKPEPPTKPLIMNEEKPPLPPPEYPRSQSGGSLPSTPGSGHREPLLEGDRYNHPPPVTAGGRRLPQTPIQPTHSYRQPPPYASIPP